jgi:hypothetical protein
MDVYIVAEEWDDSMQRARYKLVAAYARGHDARVNAFEFNESKDRYVDHHVRDVWHMSIMGPVQSLPASKQFPALFEFYDAVTGKHEKLECYHDYMAINGEVVDYQAVGAFMHRFAIAKIRRFCDIEDKSASLER